MDELRVHMMVEYKINANEDYVVETWKRHFMCSKTRTPVLMLKIALGLMLFLLIIFSLSLPDYLMTCLMTVLLILLIFGKTIDYWRMKKSVKKHPLLLKTHNLQLSEAGIASNHETGQGNTTWQAFEKAIRLDDGFLLYQGPKVFFWLPDIALTSGNLDDAKAWIQTRITQYNEVTTT